MSEPEIREFRLVAVDRRSLPADFRVGDEWVEVIGGTLRGTSQGPACNYTIKFDSPEKTPPEMAAGAPPRSRSGTISPCTLAEDETETVLTLTFEGAFARNEHGRSLPVPQGPHKYHFQAQPGESK